MKLPIRLLSLGAVLAACFAGCHAWAAAPESVAGMLYYEETMLFVRSNVARVLVLNANGTSTGIVKLGTYGLQTLSPLADGKWTYRKTGDTTAELAISDDPQFPRTLTFANDTSGTVQSSLLGGTFRLANPMATTAPLVNCSNRAFVRAGGTAVTGFVMSGHSNYALVRAIGPGLTSFGVAGVLASPALRVYWERAPIAEAAGPPSTTRAEAIRRASALVGAFPLSAATADAATIVALPTGACTVEVTGGNPDDSGEVLIEVYLLP